VRGLIVRILVVAALVRAVPVIKALRKAPTVPS
jgi:hypothetical protein